PWMRKSDKSLVSFGKKSSLSIQEQRAQLPIAAKKAELLSLVDANRTLVVIGETGSGKTTQLPQFLYDHGYGEKGIIACTQPRRVAATSVAERVAVEFGCELGQEVGYSVRFNDCSSKKTVIKFMTDGMLLREALLDDTFDRYSVVILDEA